MNTLKLLLRKFRIELLLVGTILLLGFVGVQQYRINKLSQQIYFGQLAQDSLLASNDSLREVVNLSDSLITFWSQSAVQLSEYNSDLEKKLGQQIVVAQNLQLMVDSLSISDTTTITTHTDSTVEMHFDTYKEPYTVHADVTLNTVSDDAIANFGIKLDPIKFGVYVACEKTTTDFKRANVLFSSPTWATPVIDSLQQEDDVCNPILANMSMKNSWDLFPKSIKIGLPATIVLLATLLILK